VWGKGGTQEISFEYGIQGIKIIIKYKNSRYPPKDDKLAKIIPRIGVKVMGSKRFNFFTS